MTNKIDDPNVGHAVEVNGLTRRYRTTVALDKVSMSVPRGCVFGLLGESGAGKTTLIRHLIGLLKPQTGTVRVLGLDPIQDPEGTLSRVGYLSEDRDLPGWMRLHELLRYTQGLYPHWDESFAGDLRDRFDLNLTQKINTFSRGQKAKAGLITALAHRPDLLILDEPSSGLDPVVRRHILNAVMRDVADEGRTVLFSSHLLDEVERISDYVCILHRGAVVLCDKLPTILSNHTCIHVQYNQPLDVAPEIEGALSCEGAGKDWEFLCDGKAEKVRALIAQRGAKIVRETHPSLEDIFVARIQL